MKVSDGSRHPDGRGWLTPVLVVGWWVAFGLASVVAYRQMAAAEGREFSTELILAPMASALLWIPPTWLALLCARVAPIGSARWSRTFPVHLLATLAAVFFRAIAVVLLNGVVGWYRELPPFAAVLNTSFQNNFFLYLLVTAAAHAIYYARNSRLRERQLAEARLHTLASQLQPHFLFNALNTVATLVHENPVAAEKVIVRLSALLRQTVGVKAAELVPLHQELDLLEGYLDVEKARFEERLQVEWNVSVEATDALVPHFILQPLVENSIVHGLRPLPGQVTIGVAARRSSDELIMTVTDSGAGFDEKTHKDGFGLESTRERLAAVFNDRHELTVQSRQGRGTSVTLRVPFITNGAPPVPNTAL